MSRFLEIQRRWLLTLAPAAIVLTWLLLGIAFGQDDTIQRLSATVVGGPSLYRTPEAIEYYSQKGLSKAMAGLQGNRDEAVRAFRATIKLGDMGQRAKPAIAVLIDIFPQLEHVVAKRSVHYTTGNGSLEDWVQTFIVSEKSNFVFSSSLVEFETMSKCENFIEAVPVTKLLYQKAGSGGKIVEAVADIFIILRVNAGACALARITGREFGADREAWKRWWSQENGADGSPAQPQQTSVAPRKKGLAELVVGASYTMHLVTGDDLTGVVSSKDDTSLVLKTESGSPYSISAVLIDKYEIRTAPTSSVPAAPAMEAPKPPAAVVGSNQFLSFNDLAGGTYNGKPMEISLRNGSVLRGVLVGVTGETVRLSIEGAELPLSRGSILKVVFSPK